MSTVFARHEREGEKRACLGSNSHRTLGSIGNRADLTAINLPEELCHVPRLASQLIIATSFASSWGVLALPPR
jgi:hypothetical protein